MAKHTILVFTALFLIFSLSLTGSTAYSQAVRAQVTGFAITPSKIEAYVPQGYSASVTVRVIGIKPAKMYVKWLSGSRDGINVTILNVTRRDDTTFLTLGIFAYRPGYYKYGLFIELAPRKAQGGSVRAIPVIVVPIYVIVPGVRVSLLSLHVNPAEKTAEICMGLAPYSPRGRGFRVILTAILDGKVIDKKLVYVNRGRRLCYNLGPFKPHTFHTFMLTAEAVNVSTDGLRVRFVIGRIVVHLTLALTVHNPYLTLFGGIVDADYSLTLTTNSSRCKVEMTATLGSYTKRSEYIVNGKLGTMETHAIRGKIAAYTPPQLLIPLATMPLRAYALAKCVGVDHPAIAESSNVLVVIDLTPILVYAGIAAVVYAVLRTRRRRRRKTGEEGMEATSGEG